MDAQRRFGITAAALFLLLGLLGATLPGIGSAVAQGYPNRPIKLVVPSTAGSPSDIGARIIGDKLSLSLKQPFVIEDRPGAGGNIGTEVIARAAPDGYTLGLVLGTTLTVNPSLFKKLPFDPENDFRPISIVTTTGNMLVVHPSIPVTSVAEFVVYAKAATAGKQPIAYASGGNGNPGHLVMENFRVRAGFDAIHVPYRGNAPMVTDLVAGQVKVAFVTSAGMMDHVQAGRLRALGVSRAHRSPLAPEVPTIAESGYPGFNIENFTVMLAPAGIPEPIAALLERSRIDSKPLVPANSSCFRGKKKTDSPCSSLEAASRAIGSSRARKEIATSYLSVLADSEVSVMSVLGSFRCAPNTHATTEMAAGFAACPQSI